MRTVSIAALSLGGVLCFSGAARAGVLASAVLGDGITPAKFFNCNLNNIGTKPVEILSAHIFNAAGTDVTGVDTCSPAVAPGTDCAIDSVSNNGRIVVKVKGGTGQLRGACLLFSAGGLLGSIDMR
jgi:hypothetical protein